MKRKQLSKKTRFDIFKRDAFVCQYCGAHPPQAILHVDHILAVASGGGNDSDNLITSCADCNGGKGARSLKSVPQPLAEKMDDLAEREAQIAGYQSLLAEKRKRIESGIASVMDVYERFYPEWTLTESAGVSIGKFIEGLGLECVIDAMEIACERWKWNKNKTFRYFCGICWHRVRENQDA